MRIRKSVAALALCATSAGVSLLGAGTALADVDKEYGPYPTQEKCSEVGMSHTDDPGFVGFQCAAREDGHYAVVTYR